MTIILRSIFSMTSEPSVNKAHNIFWGSVWFECTLKKHIRLTMKCHDNKTFYLGSQFLLSTVQIKGRGRVRSCLKMKNNVLSNINKRWWFPSFPSSLNDPQFRVGEQCCNSLVCLVCVTSYDIKIMSVLMLLY